MAFYLSTFVGDGRTDPFQPPVDGAFAIIDLRGDPTIQDGRCLLWTPDEQPTRAGRNKIGDLDPDDTMPRSVSRLIESHLGLTLDSTDRLRAIIAELLILHGTIPSDKTRWNPLQADRRGVNRIYLGGEIYRAPAIKDVVVTDDFNRADELLGASANWDYGDHQVGAVVSNQLSLQGTFGRDTAYWSADTFQADCYVQADYITASTHDGGLALRISTGDVDPDHGDLYAARDNNSGTDIVKFVGGSFTRIGSDGGDPSQGAWYFEADGSTLTLDIDTVQTIQVTDTSITAGGYSGFITDGYSGVWDNFEAGDLGIPPSASIAGTLSVSGTLTQIQQVAGSVAASSTASASAVQTHEMTGTMSATATTSGTPTQLQRIAATVKSTLSAAASALQIQRIGAAVDAMASFVGTLTKGNVQTTKGGLTLSETRLGGLTLSESLVGTVSVSDS